MYLKIQNVERDAAETVSEIREIYLQAEPILATALLPLIADAEKLRQRLGELAEAVRAEERNQTEKWVS